MNKMDIFFVVGFIGNSKKETQLKLLCLSKNKEIVRGYCAAKNFSVYDIFTYNEFLEYATKCDKVNESDIFPLMSDYDNDYSRMFDNMFKIRK